MLKINVYDITGERAILDSDGDLIYNKIVSALSNNNDVELSFENVTTILSIFTTSAIGQLYKKFTSDFLNKHLKITHMSPDDLISLKRVNERAKQFYSSPESMTDFLEGEIFDENNNQ